MSVGWLRTIRGWATRAPALVVGMFVGVFLGLPLAVQAGPYFPPSDGSDPAYQGWFAPLDYLGATTPAADRLPYYDSSSSAAVTPFTGFGRSLVDDADASAGRTTLALGTIATQDANNVTISGGSVTGITDLAVADGGTGASTAANARTNLGVAIGSDVQAYDAELAAIAGTTSAADKGLYYTGSGTAGTYDLTSYARTLLDDTTAGAWRTTLGLGTIATQDANNVSITGGSATLTGTLVWPQSTGPSQTAEGSFAWDTNDDLLTVGDGSATLRLAPYQELVTGTGTWTKPSYIRSTALALVECWGVGGPGGSGRRGAAGAVRAGGGGGGAGGYAYYSRSLTAGDFNGLTVTMGSAGTPGGGRGVDDSSGSDGTSGGTTSWGSLVIAAPGVGGPGGTNSNGTTQAPPGAPSAITLRNSSNAVTPPNNAVIAGSGGIASTSTAAIVQMGGHGYAGVAGGGGAGGGRTAGDSTITSGAGGNAWTGVAGPSGTSGNGTTGTAGGDRQGGAGGGFGLSAAAGAGGAGGAYGGGGGGGGASLNGFTSGDGGAGGAPACRITIWQ